jgi:hypothetical protein
LGPKANAVKDIRETDWKRLRELKPALLDRFCSRALSEIVKASSDSAMTPHERYLKVYGLIQDEDKELGRMFDDLKRSNAVRKLFLMQRAGLLTQDEWAGFSGEIKDAFVQNQTL